MKYDKLRLVLLIDDEAADNYIHKLFWEESGFCEKIISFSKALDALEFLGTKVQGQYPLPDIIFLDINMPRMDGFQFLDAYRKLEIPGKDETLIIILSTSRNPFDIEKVKNYTEIKEYRVKPLETEDIEEIMGTYFGAKA